MIQSKIMIGTWSLSGDYGHIKMNQIYEALNFAYDSGFRQYDTAPSYGNGFMEFCLGNVFYNKNDVKINTKIGNLPFEGKSFDIPLLKKSFDQTLKRLKRENVNILYLHNPRNDVSNYSELIDFLNNLKVNGYINKLGLSMAMDFDYSDKIDINRFDVIQNDVNLINLSPLNRSFNENIKLVARSPLASGMLTENFLNTQAYPDDDHRSKWLRGKKLLSMKKRVKMLKKVSSMNLTSFALKFLLQDTRVNHIICGIKHKSHVIDLLELDGCADLTKIQIDTIFKLYEDNYGFRSGH
jgi:aryl-alcohol dehydrogenase-like predicted oxidoreductase